MVDNHKNAGVDLPLENFKPKPKVKNIATDVFEMAGVDYDNIDVTDSFEVGKLITKNINVISKAIFNAVNGGNYFLEERFVEVNQVFSHKTFREMQQGFYTIKNDVKKMCINIKDDNQDAVGLFDLAGVTYKHGSLPEECDGLFD